MRHRLLSAALLICFGAALAAEDALALNVLPLEAPVEMAKRFRPLAEYLGAQLGRPVEVKPGKDYTASIESVGTLKHQFAYTSPTLWTKMRRLYPDAGLEMVALVAIDGKPFTNSLIIVPKDSPAKTLADLKGKSFAFGNEDSTGSHLYPRWMLKQAGIDRDGGLGSYKYTGSHANVLKAVESGAMDAGGLTESTARKGVEAGTVRSLAVSEPIPEFAIVVNKAFPAELKAKLITALTGLSAGKPEQAAIVMAINKKATGFTAATGSEYDVPAKMITELYGEAFFQAK
jgi:phosphonate transport system substrate-binding protein